MRITVRPRGIFADSARLPLTAPEDIFQAIDAVIRGELNGKVLDYDDVYWTEDGGTTVFQPGPKALRAATAFTDYLHETGSLGFGLLLRLSAAVSYEQHDNYKKAETIYRERPDISGTSNAYAAAMAATHAVVLTLIADQVAVQRREQLTRG